MVFTMGEADGWFTLKLVQDDAAEIVERLRETHVDTQGRAYLIRLDTIIGRLGEKWQAKQRLVFEHLKTSFERKFQEPNWCIKINDDSFLAVILTLGEHKGAVSAAELWYATGQFFVGDVTQTRPPLFEVVAEDVDQVRLKAIELSKYFDRAEARPFRTPAAPPIATSADPERKAPTAVGVMVNIQRPSNVGTLLTVGGRELRVASAIEPVFEMKKLAMIGHRFEPVVTEARSNVSFDAKAIAALGWSDREQVDIANIEQGVSLLRMRSPEQRKMLMVVPAAFSTFASARARMRFTAILAKAQQDMGLKILFEIHELSGVPLGRMLEVVSLLKPYCMTTMGHVAGEPRAILALKGCGLAGACITYDGSRRDADALEMYLGTLSVAAKGSTGACMIQGFDNLQQMAIARLAGVSHATVRTSALMASRAS